MQNIEKIAAILLLLPLLIEWTPGITGGLTWNILGFPFYWPNLFLILYYAITPAIELSDLQQEFKRIILLLLIYSPLSLFIFENGRHAWGLYLVSLQFFIILLVFILKPPTLDQILFLKWIIIALFIYLSAQMILSALGIWQYTETAKLDGNMLYARASTKLGDCNQSSIILFLLTVIITNFYIEDRWINLIIIGITFVAVAMVATRGALISIFIFFLAYTLINIWQESLKYKLLIFVGAIGMSVMVVKYNILNDVINRQTELELAGDATAGRDLLILKALNTSFNDSPIIGVGPNRVFPLTRTLTSARNSGLSISRYSTAPHNTWILILCSFGLLGLGLFLYIAFCIIKRIDFHDPLSWAILCVFLVNMNTEAILLYGEILTFICLIITGALLKTEYENTYSIETLDSSC